MILSPKPKPQTLFKDQPVIQYAMSNDYEGFSQAELNHRKTCLPPNRQVFCFRRVA